jgi:hypothetical protein
MWLLDLLEPMEPIGAQVFSMEACSDDSKWIFDGMEVWVNERLRFFSNRSLAQGAPGQGFRKCYGVETVRFYGNYFGVLAVCAPKPSSIKGKCGNWFWPL